MSYNYSKLLGKITEVFGTQARFSKALGLSEHTVSAKLNGKIDWKQREIVRCCSILGIGVNDIQAYFFSEKVQND